MSEFHTKCAFTLGGKCERHAMHRWWAFTPQVWCEFGGFSSLIFSVHENAIIYTDHFNEQCKCSEHLNTYQVLNIALLTVLLT